jgi:RAB protein geranylgeranyltransferase component A
MDREAYYGGESASLNLTQVRLRFRLVGTAAYVSSAHRPITDERPSLNICSSRIY